MNGYHLPTISNADLDNLIASGNGGQMAIDERNRRLLSGYATLVALKSAVDDIVRSAPEGHDVVIIYGDLIVHKVRFIEPHAFLFEGITQDGKRAGVVLHSSPMSVRVIHVAPRQPSVPRVITGFSKPE
jgi:hypothetical protein